MPVSQTGTARAVLLASILAVSVGTLTACGDDPAHPAAGPASSAVTPSVTPSLGGEASGAATIPGTIGGAATAGTTGTTPSGAVAPSAGSTDSQVWNFAAVPGASAAPITGTLAAKWKLTRANQTTMGRYVESIYYAGSADLNKGRSIRVQLDVGATDGLPHYVSCMGGGPGVDRTRDTAARDFVEECFQAVVPPAERAKFQEWFDTSFSKTGSTRYHYSGTGFGSSLLLTDNWINVEMVGHDPKAAPDSTPLGQ
ncbi:hypothetical protein [Actinoplanes sp. NPDC020271]|uniref:hypothetical protein n=1 Tax=Actinoplanes sp. NPDC020271 TaxID=3363896 RepID=UPI0037B29412